MLDHAPAGQEHQGPAYGWVESLKLVGETLVARLKQVPEEIKALADAGRYKHRSAEIFLDFQGTGRKYLKRIAMLGAAVPAVKGLAPFKFADDGGPSVTVDFQDTLKKEEQPMSETYTQSQHERLVEAAVTKAVKEAEGRITQQLTEQLTAKDEEVATFKEKADKAEKALEVSTKRISTIEAGAAESEVKTFCEKLVAEGKVTPAEAEDLQVTLMALPNDEASAIEFSEGEKETPRARFMKTYEAREAGSAVPLKEVAKSTDRGTETVTFGEGAEQIRVPKEVVASYESNRGDYEKMNVTLEEFARSELHHSAA